jgi:hypothetical protein
MHVDDVSVEENDYHNEDQQWTPTGQSRIYQSDIVTVVLLIFQYMYVHHLNLYVSF